MQRCERRNAVSSCGALITRYERGNGPSATPIGLCRLHAPCGLSGFGESPLRRRVSQTAVPGPCPERVSAFPSSGQGPGTAVCNQKARLPFQALGKAPERSFATGAPDWLSARPDKSRSERPQLPSVLAGDRPKEKGASWAPCSGKDNLPGGVGEQGECVPDHPASSDGFMWRGSQGECTPEPHIRSRWTVLRLRLMLQCDKRSFINR